MAARILVNDDEAALTLGLRRALESAGFEVTVTHRAEDAFDILSAEKPDLLITDLAMPGLSGDELMARMTERDLFVPVIAMSGSLRPADRKYPFFEKPFSARDLIAFIRAHLEDLRDIQQLKAVAAKHLVRETSVGKVVHFNAARGWGLLRVIGREAPLYVNASEIRNPHSSFSQLRLGQIVSFSGVADHQRGPRAIDVSVIYDDCALKRPCAPRVASSSRACSETRSHRSPGRALRRR